MSSEGRVGNDAVVKANLGTKRDGDGAERGYLCRRFRRSFRKRMASLYVLEARRVSAKQKITTANLHRTNANERVARTVNGCLLCLMRRSWRIVERFSFAFSHLRLGPEAYQLIAVTQLYFHVKSSRIRVGSGLN